MVIESNSQFDLINSVNIYKHPKILQIRYITLFLTFIEECSSYLRNIDVSENGEDKKNPSVYGHLSSVSICFSLHSRFICIKWKKDLGVEKFENKLAQNDFFAKFPKHPIYSVCDIIWHVRFNKIDKKKLK